MRLMLTKLLDKIIILRRSSCSCECCILLVCSSLFNTKKNFLSSEFNFRLFSHDSRRYDIQQLHQALRLQSTEALSDS